MSAAVEKAERRPRGVALGAAGWLGLAAAPTFALMALLNAVPGGDAGMTGMSMPPASPLGGMVTMYLLMSLFHLAPWLRLAVPTWSDEAETSPRRAGRFEGGVHE